MGAPRTQSRAPTPPRTRTRRRGGSLWPHEERDMRASGATPREDVLTGLVVDSTRAVPVHHDDAVDAERTRRISFPMFVTRCGPMIPKPEGHEDDCRHRRCIRHFTACCPRSVLYWL